MNRLTIETAIVAMRDRAAEAGDLVRASLASEALRQGEESEVWAAVVDMLSSGPFDMTETETETETETTKETSETMNEHMMSVTSKHTNGTKHETETEPKSAPRVHVARPVTGDMRALLAALVAAIPGRADAIRVLVIAALARQHALMIGPPGTGKSYLARLLSECLNARYFEALITRYSTPEDLLGPIDVSQIPAGRYVRHMAGYLPTAEVAFLDEIFKGSSAILNALLSITNERVIHDGGRVIQTPIRTILAASNELPDPDDGLDAIADRFLVRCEVDYVPSGDFRNVLTHVTPSSLPVVDLDAEVLATSQVTVTSEVLDAMVTLRDGLAADKIVASDRRWRASLDVLRASAYLDGRPDTDLDDLYALAFVLAPPARRADVDRHIAKIVSPTGSKATERVKAARDLLATVPPIQGSDADTVLAALRRIAPEIKAIVTEVGAMQPSRGVIKARKDLDDLVAQIKARVGEAQKAQAEVL